jgi:hypothetical protein
MAYSAAQLRRLEELEGRESAVEYESFLELVRDDPSPQARLEPQVYCTLTVEEKLQAHRGELERLQAAYPGIDAELWQSMIEAELRSIDDLERRGALVQRVEASPGSEAGKGVKSAGIRKPAPDRLAAFREADGEHSIEPRYT